MAYINIFFGYYKWYKKIVLIEDRKNFYLNLNAIYLLAINCIDLL